MEKRCLKLSSDAIWRFRAPPLRPRPPPVALVALALIVGSGLYAVLDLFFPPALSLALVCLPILPWLRPGFLRSPRTPVDAQESVEVLPRFPITVQAGAMSAALALAVLAGGLSTHAQRRAGASDCRLNLADGAEGPVAGWFVSTPVEKVTNVAGENVTPGGGDEPLVRRLLLCSCSLSLGG